MVTGVPFGHKALVPPEIHALARSGRERAVAQAAAVAIAKPKTTTGRYKPWSSRRFDFASLA
jgi:hypothetical protein